MNQIILETSAMLVAIYCFCDCYRTKTKTGRSYIKGRMNKLKDQHYSFVLLLISLIVSAAASVTDMVLENYFLVRSLFILYLLNEIFYIFHTALGFLFAVYVMNLTGVFGKGRSTFDRLFPLPLILCQILVLLNPITKWIFYIDTNYRYNRGPLLWMLYALCVFYIGYGIIYFMINKQLVSKFDRMAVFILMLIAVLGIVIQAVFAITVELFFESIAFLGFMLLLEDRTLRERAGRYGRMSKSSIVVIALVFFTVIAMNINLIYHAGTDQTERIGETQVNNIKGEMQQRISESESHLFRYSMGLEQMINDKAPHEKVEKYIKDQQDYYLATSNGNCFRAYAASPDWTIIPGFDMPEEYHAVERLWYIGATRHPGQVYISKPYIDADNGHLCYTFSYTLSDGRTVAAMDYTLSTTQEIVKRMSTDVDRFAMIVTDDGTIVACSNEHYQGEELAKALPTYTEMFERVRASKEHRSFITRIEGAQKIIFSSETNNGWKLILVVDYSEFYAGIMDQMILLGAIDILMVAVIIVFYMVSLNNQARSERTLSTTENFIKSLSDDIRNPLNDILKTSSMFPHGEPGWEEVRAIHEAGLRLKETTDNLIAFSDIARSENNKETISEGRRRRHASSVSSRYMRNGIISILIASLLIGLVLCTVISTRWGTVRIGREADRYNNSVSQWMDQKQSILRMFSDVIAADPSVLDDYDKAVEWLDDVAENYSDMTFAYMANPYNTEHPIIMNNGWVPDEDYKVEERQWYIDTERSGDGYSISAPYYDAQTGLYCVTFSRSVYAKDGSFLGIFAIDCLLDKLVGVLADSYNSDSYAFMVDRNGIIINHPYKQYEMSPESSVNVEDTEYAAVYHDGNEFWMRDYDGRLVACCSEKSSLSGFSVIVVQSWWSIYGQVIFMVLIFLIMLIGSIIAVAKMINRFIGWQEETNDRLVRAKDTAVAAEKAKSRFLAQMSHEIRTPINAVLGMNEMILRESADPSIREYADSIQSAGKNLLGLINTILDFSKIEEGKMEIIPVRYDTATMILNMINSVAKRAADKGIEFEAHVDGELPTTLYGDDMRVSQVAVNLLTNAVKYTPEGKVDLYVEKESSDDKTISLRVRVRDTGIGIKEEDIGKLFESFTRLEETRNRNIEGTGLGMAIVNRLLSMMGSNLEVESVYGEGSEFAFTVKQEIIDQTPIGDFEQRAKKALDENGDDTYVYAPGAKILIVDDNELNLKVISNLLKLNGIKPELLLSGQEMLDELKTGNRYDIIMLDHMMPKMDGIEALEKAKEEKLLPEGCAVIALTANAVVGARESYLNAGFDDYLSKPVDVTALEAILAKFLPGEMIEYRKKSGYDAGKDNDREKDDSTEFDALEGAGIDTKEGMKYSGQDKEFYRNVLAEYLYTAKDRTEELDSAFSERDMATYAIRVHALKSVSKTIGAQDVADVAAKLEMAAKAGDEEEVVRGHDELLRQYHRITSVIETLGLPAPSITSDDEEVLEFGPE